MIKKYALILLAVLALTLSACQRAASVAPVGTPSPDANFPQPLATTSMNAIEMAGTQTAIATAGLPMPTAAGTVDPNATQAPAVNPTFTPLAGINPTQAVNTPLPTVTAQAPEATAAPTQSNATVSKPGTYALHEGEFPYCLARRFNVNPDQLLSLNGISNGQSYFAAGTVITIPQSGGSFPGARALKSHPAQYTVRSGDTIYSIACEFGDVDPMGIVSANNLGGSYSLTAGTTISIP
jgi:LysM repeat protein